MIKRKFFFSKKDYDMIECDNSFILDEKLPKGEDITRYEIHVMKPPEEDK